MKNNFFPPDVAQRLEGIKRAPHRLGWIIGYKKLDIIHSKWIRYCWDNPGAHALMAFRGSYKTSAVVITGIIRYLLFFPNATIFIIRKTYKNACEIVKAVSRAFDNPLLQKIFLDAHGFVPRKVENAESRLRFNFRNSAAPEPSLQAYGIGTAATGAHADVIIADDIIGLEDRISAAERDYTKTIIQELAGNIANPNARTIWLGTKWARGDGWDTIQNFTPIKKYPLSKYNFLPQETVEEKRRMLTPLLFAINYELEPIEDESLLFQNPTYGTFDVETWRKQPVFMHLDAAYGGADYCALTIKSGNFIKGWLYGGNVTQWYDFIKARYKEYHCQRIYLESNADKGFLARELRALGLNTHSYNENMQKALKISTYLYIAWKDLIWDEQTDPEYMNQILDWRETNTSKNEHDDAPDSAACLCKLTNKEKTSPLDNAIMKKLYG